METYRRASIESWRRLGGGRRRVDLRDDWVKKDQGNVVLWVKSSICSKEVRQKTLYGGLPRGKIKTCSFANHTFIPRGRNLAPKKRLNRKNQNQPSDSSSMIRKH